MYQAKKLGIPDAVAEQLHKLFTFMQSNDVEQTKLYLETRFREMAQSNNVNVRLLTAYYAVLIKSAYTKHGTRVVIVDDHEHGISPYMRLIGDAILDFGLPVVAEFTVGKRASISKGYDPGDQREEFLKHLDLVLITCGEVNVDPEVLLEKRDIAIQRYWL